MRQVRRRYGVQDGALPSIQFLHRQSTFHVMVQQRRKACVTLVVPNTDLQVPTFTPFSHHRRIVTRPAREALRSAINTRNFA